ncbi:MAG: hypothetical protein L0G36_09375, partial [Brevibacterium sp.]|nr:hypothetical protein [Brevibacterium sp.]
MSTSDITESAGATDPARSTDSAAAATDPAGAADPGGTARSRQKVSASRRPGQRRIGKVLLGLLAWLIGLLFVSPLLWMLLTSLHAETDASTNPPSFFAPLTLESYSNFFGGSSGVSPWPYLINSAVAAIVSTLIVLVLSTMAA